MKMYLQLEKSKIFKPSNDLKKKLYSRNYALNIRDMNHNSDILRRHVGYFNNCQGYQSLHAR